MQQPLASPLAGVSWMHAPPARHPARRHTP